MVELVSRDFNVGENDLTSNIGHRVLLVEDNMDKEVLYMIITLVCGIAICLVTLYAGIHL